MRNRARGRRLRPGLERLGDRCLPSGFAPAEIAAAYGLDSIVFQSPNGEAVQGDGAGQTIAIVGAHHNPSLESDLRVFSREFGLPDAALTVVNLAGEEAVPAWAVESALDVEWAHALAPGASILVVEARSDSAADLMEAVDIARRAPGVVAISMSWGFPEASSQRASDVHFTTPAGHAGVTFIAASGDHGPEGGAVYPASSPNVVGVGGTSLVLGPGGGVESETTWSQSGAGPSLYSARPSYQNGTARKGTPDVAFLGDPATGVRIYHTPPGEAAGSWRVMAGTSLGAPAWAAIMAIVAQGRALQGRPSPDGPSETLPLLYGLSAANFRSIQTPGLPEPGRGVPVGQTLIPNLVSGETTTTATTTAATATKTRTPIRPAVRPRPTPAARAAQFTGRRARPAGPLRITARANVFQIGAEHRPRDRR